MLGQDDGSQRTSSTRINATISLIFFIICASVSALHGYRHINKQQFPVFAETTMIAEDSSPHCPSPPFVPCLLASQHCVRTIAHFRLSLRFLNVLDDASRCCVLSTSSSIRSPRLRTFSAVDELRALCSARQDDTTTPNNKHAQHGALGNAGRHSTYRCSVTSLPSRRPTAR